MERRLWPDSGYYLANGASLCDEHHLASERTLISPEQIRDAANITEILVPPQLDKNEKYDKWGNCMLPNGMRTCGELFFDPSVLKALEEGGVLSLFSHLIKYPRTYHLPWSPGITNDDRMMPNTKALESEEIIVTEKMDGENTTLMNHKHNPALHARSINGYQPHESRNWMKKFHSIIGSEIPLYWRLCCENMYAEHSIHYEGLATYALGFAIWNDRNEILAWKDTLEWFDLLGINSVPVLYEGPWNEDLLRNLQLGNKEGYVVRVTGPIKYSEFRYKVGKFVRTNHVQTTRHWLKGNVKPNELYSGLNGFEKVLRRYNND